MGDIRSGSDSARSAAPTTGNEPRVQFNGNGFFEPISGEWLSRTGDTPVADWIRSLPDNAIGLSTLNRWAEPMPASAVVGQIQHQIRASMGLSTDPTRIPTITETVSAEFNDIKVGYAMGSLASAIERRIAANPTIDNRVATELVSSLRQQARALSIGASDHATADPSVFAFREVCYPSANAMAQAVLAYNASVPQLREYTPEMQRQNALRALDQSVMEQGFTPGIGYSWGATAYMYTRGRTDDIDSLRRAYAAGSLADIGLGVGGAFAGVDASRSGARLLGAQPALTAPPRSSPPYTEAATIAPLVPVRPSWRTSETNVIAQLTGQGYRSQLSFRGGVEVPYGTPGSVRPEAYRPGSSIEVKNYNVETARGRTSLANNISTQVIDRAANLPPNTVQTVYIDVRGQSVSRADLNALIQNIVQKSNGAISAADIHIVR